MFKKIHPEKSKFVIERFPHCDSRILHSPKTCEFCDAHSDWQALREAWGIAFTGWTPEEGQLPCPANNARGDQVDKRWYGNVASPVCEDSLRRGFLGVENGKPPEFCVLVGCKIVGPHEHKIEGPVSTSGLPSGRYWPSPRS